MPGGKAQLLRSVDQSRALSILGSSPVSRRTSHSSLRCCSGTAQVVSATHITSIRSAAIGRDVDLRHTFVKSSLTSPRHSCPGAFCTKILNRGTGRCVWTARATDIWRNQRGRRLAGRPGDALPSSPRAGRTRDVERRSPRLRVQPPGDHRHRSFPPAAALGPTGEPGALCAHVQRRDLQLLGDPRRTGQGPRRQVLHRGRLRGHRRCIPLLG